MAIEKLENSVDKALQAFVDGEIKESKQLLKLIKKDDLNFSIKIKNSEPTLNEDSIRYMLDLQHAIYQIAALCLYGSMQVKKLSNKEKEKLKIDFKISKGSTGIIPKIYEVLESFPQTEELALAMPTEYALVAIAYIVVNHGINLINKGHVIIDRHKSSKQRDRMLDQKDRMLDQEDKMLDQEDKRINLLAETNQKLSEKSNKFQRIFAEHEKKIFRTSYKTGHDIELNNVPYTADEIKKINEQLNEQENTMRVGEEIAYIPIKSLIEQKSENFYIAICHIIELDIISCKILIEEVSEKPSIIEASYDKGNHKVDVGNIQKKINLSVNKESPKFVIEFEVSNEGGMVKRKVISVKDNE